MRASIFGKCEKQKWENDWLILNDEWLLGHCGISSQIALCSVPAPLQRFSTEKKDFMLKSCLPQFGFWRDHSSLHSKCHPQQRRKSICINKRTNKSFSPCAKIEDARRNVSERYFLNTTLTHSVCFHRNLWRAEVEQLWLVIGWRVGWLLCILFYNDLMIDVINHYWSYKAIQKRQARWGEMYGWLCCVSQCYVCSLSSL